MEQAERLTVRAARNGSAEAELGGALTKFNAAVRDALLIALDNSIIDTTIVVAG